MSDQTILIHHTISHKSQPTPENILRIAKYNKPNLWEVKAHISIFFFLIMIKYL